MSLEQSPKQQIPFHLIHIGCEVLVLVGIYFVLINKIGELNRKIEIYDNNFEILHKRLLLLENKKSESKTKVVKEEIKSVKEEVAPLLEETSLEEIEETDDDLDKELIEAINI